MPVDMTPRCLSAVLALALASGCTSPSSEAPVPEPARPATPVSEPQPVATAPVDVPVPASPAPADDAPALAIEGEGLRLFDMQSGKATPIAFGQPKQQVLAVLERFRGAARQDTNADCGAGPVQIAQWPDGLSLVFQGDRFVGWGVGRADGGLSTAIGIGLGSTRSDLGEAYADVSTRATTLGTEFSAGGMHGVLDGATPGSAITALWAGTSCVAR